MRKSIIVLILILNLFLFSNCSGSDMEHSLDRKAIASGLGISGEKTTPLHEAVANGKMDDVIRLIDEGANINAVAMDMLTPLHFAVMENKLEIAKYLLAHGADVNLTGSENESIGTPLHIASARGGSEEMVRLLIKYGANSNALDKHQATPLHIAASDGRLEIVKLLLENGADPNVKDMFGATPLHHAIYLYDKGLPSRLEITRVLIENGAKLNIKDNDGRTPLQLATELKDKKMIGFLGKY